jgi:hypothetical protein
VLCSSIRVCLESLMFEIMLAWDCSVIRIRYKVFSASRGYTFKMWMMISVAFYIVAVEI